MRAIYSLGMLQPAILTTKQLFCGPALLVYCKEGEKKSMIALVQRRKVEHFILFGRRAYEGAGFELGYIRYY